MNRLTVLLPLILLLSCTEDVDLDPITEIRPVVEARIVEGQTAWIKLTTTVSKTGPASFPPVTDAAVIISDDQGGSETLIHTGGGVYQTLDLKGDLNTTYTVGIQTAGEVIRGTSTMPADAIPLDSVTHRYDSLSPVDPLVSVLTLFFPGDTDPFQPGLIRFYRNSSRLGGTYFFENASSGGSFLNLLFQFSNPFSPGDVIRVECHAVEPVIFDYFKTIVQNSSEDIIGGLTIAPPENPPGNLEDDALGYFSAMTVSARTVMVE